MMEQTVFQRPIVPPSLHMKKIIALTVASLALLTASTASAAVFMEHGTSNSGFGCGMCGGGSFWLMPLAGIVFFAAASFVFSLVFWLVYRWLIKK